MKETRIREVIFLLEKIGWQFNGFDKCNLEFVFMKENDVCEWVDFVALMPSNMSFSRRKLDGFKFHYSDMNLNQFEIPLFMELYNYMHDTRKGLPLDLAKEQKAYDNAFKWECGETYCTFENGVLSCGVIDDEE